MSLSIGAKIASSVYWSTFIIETQILFINLKKVEDFLVFCGSAKNGLCESWSC